MGAKLDTIFMATEIANDFSVLIFVQRELTLFVDDFVRIQCIILHL